MMSSCEARVVPERRLTLNDALASSGFLEGFLRRKNMNQAIGIPDGAGSNPALRSSTSQVLGGMRPDRWVASELGTDHPLTVRPFPASNYVHCGYTHPVKSEA